MLSTSITDALAELGTMVAASSQKLVALETSRAVDLQ